MNINLAPQVYAYRPKITNAVGGAFGSTVAPRQASSSSQGVLLTKVNIPFRPNQGLFHEA